MSPPLTTRAPFYGMALAEAHAEAFNGTFMPGFSWLAQQIKAAARQPYLFDIGCGDGFWLQEAAGMGIPGEGIDLSVAFVSLARARGVTAQQESAAAAVAPEGTTAITALGEVFSYMPTTLAPALHMAARRLPSGGVLIFDMPGPDTPEGTSEAVGRAWSMTSTVTRKDDLLTREIVLQLKRQKVRETHEQHLFPPEEVEGIVTGFGFDAEVVDSYGPCPLLPGRYGIVARKP